MIGIVIVISALVTAFLTMLINYVALRRSMSYGGGGGGGGGGASSGTTMTSFTNRMFNPDGVRGGEGAGRSRKEQEQEGAEGGCREMMNVQKNMRKKKDA